MATKDNCEKYAKLMLALHQCEIGDGFGELAHLVEDMSALLLCDEEITKEQRPTLWYEIGSREHGVVDLYHSTGFVRIDADGVVSHHPLDPIPHSSMTITVFEFKRLQECENAWKAVYNQLLAFNPEFCQGEGTGKELAILEIMRLQLIAHHNRSQTMKGG